MIQPKPLALSVNTKDMHQSAQYYFDPAQPKSIRYTLRCQAGHIFRRFEK